MKRTIFLQDENAIWLKGNLHSHSTMSDGKLTPEEMKEAYKHHGYDFLVISDHDRYTDTRHMSEDNFTMVQGFELYGNATDEKDIHIHLLWDDNFDEFQHGQYIHLPERTGKATKAFCEEMKAKGAYIMLNHPHWSMLTSAEVEVDSFYDGVVVFFFVCVWVVFVGVGWVLWCVLVLGVWFVGWCVCVGCVVIWAIFSFVRSLEVMFLPLLFHSEGIYERSTFYDSRSIIPMTDTHLHRESKGHDIVLCPFSCNAHGLSCL